MEDLIGTAVLVHRELTKDPVGRQGQVGMIISADVAKDEVFVGFGNNKPGLYSSDALLVLKPHQDLFKDLMANTRDLDQRDFKALLRISMLVEDGSNRSQRYALMLAMTSEQVLNYSTQSLEDKLELRQSVNQEIDRGGGLAR